MSRILLIVNANATRHSARRQRTVQQTLAASHKLEVAATGHRGHATILAKEAVAEGMDSVVVLGGDGTINEAINGLADTDVKLGLLPGGNTNVLARTIGMSRRLDTALDQLVRALAMDRTRSIGLGRLNDRWFAFVAGIGFDAAVVAAVEERVRMKHMYGDWFFVASAFNTYFRGYDRIHRPLSVEWDSHYEDALHFSLIFNSNPYTYIKSRALSPVPEATFDRGLWFVAFRSMKAKKVLAMIGSALKKGKKFRTDPTILMGEDLSSFTMRSAKPLPYQVDGDYLGDLTEARFTWEPNVLQIIH